MPIYIDKEKLMATWVQLYLLSLIGKTNTWYVLFLLKDGRVVPHSFTDGITLSSGVESGYVVWSAFGLELPITPLDAVKLAEKGVKELFNSTVKSLDERGFIVETSKLRSLRAEENKFREESPIPFLLCVIAYAALAVIATGIVCFRVYR